MPDAWPTKEDIAAMAKYAEENITPADIELERQARKLRALYAPLGKFRKWGDTDA